MVLRGDNSYIFGELSYFFENLNVFYKVFYKVWSMKSCIHDLLLKNTQFDSRLIFGVMKNIYDS